MLSGSNVTELGSNDKENSPSADKNVGVVLEPCRTWKCVLTVILGDVKTLNAPECHLSMYFLLLFGLHLALQNCSLNEAKLHFKTHFK